MLVQQRLSPGTPFSFTNKIGRHDITEILLKVVLNTITLTTVVMKFSTFLVFYEDEQNQVSTNIQKLKI